jgi:hypothetical protein
MRGTFSAGAPARASGGGALYDCAAYKAATAFNPTLSSCILRQQSDVVAAAQSTLTKSRGPRSSMRRAEGKHSVPPHSLNVPRQRGNSFVNLYLVLHTKRGTTASEPERYRLPACYRSKELVAGCAMSDADHATPELYRQAAQKLRELADQSHLPDIRGDLLNLSARFERMAAYFEAQRRLGPAGDTGKS